MVHLHSLFDDSVEKHAACVRCPSVESERELIQIVGKVLLTDSSLQGTQQPSLEERSDSVHCRHLDMSRGRGSRKHRYFVLESEGSQSSIRRPTVRSDDAPRLHHILDEVLKNRPRQIGDVSETDPPHAYVLEFDSDGNDGFLDSLAASHAGFFSTHVTLVDLDTSRKSLSPRTHHRPSKFMKPRPSSCIALQPEHSLETERVGPVLLACDLPHRPKPNTQRLPSTLEDSTSCQPGLGSAVTTQQDISSGTPWDTALATCTADESIGPPHTLQVKATVFLAGKELVELDNISWIVHPGTGQRAGISGHAA